jgi:hypothetical protein
LGPLGVAGMSFQYGSPEAAFGRSAELMVRDILIERGWKLVMACEFNGLLEDIPPMLATKPGESLVLPDILGVKDMKIAWFEVKAKLHSETYRNWDNKEVHGISLRQFDNYRDIHYLFNCPVYILIVEVEGRRVLFGDTSQMIGPKSCRINTEENPPDEGGSIYFDVSFLSKLSVPDYAFERLFPQEAKEA